VQTSTVDIPLGIDKSRRGHRLRLLFFLTLTAITILALSGWFGVRSRTVTASAGGYRAELEFASISRRGVTVPWRVTVDSERGFSDDVVVTIPSSYLSRVSIRSMQPEPEQSTTDGGNVVWTFSSPPGTRFNVELDAEIDPSALAGWIDANTAVRIGAATIGPLHYRSWIWP
jgi:hypothetical protein